MPNMEGLSDGASISGPGDKSMKRGSQSRSPNRVLGHIGESEDD